MASTVLPNGIIVPEKFSRDWYADLYHNWQELDNLLGGGGANDGTLTIQKNGTTVGTFSANQATDETINIEVPDVNNGTLTIQQNGTTVDTFTANSSSDKTVNFITGVSWNDVSNKPSFATVATSGSYNDLSNKPTIPKVNNATLTIQKNGTTVDTFTANSSSDKTVNISVPTNTNELTNGAGFIASEIDSKGNGWVRFKCGLQICYGRVINDNSIETGKARYSFPVAFIAAPYIVAAPAVDGAYFVTAYAKETTNWCLDSIAAYGTTIQFTPNPLAVNYVAMGKWK